MRTILFFTLFFTACSSGDSGGSVAGDREAFIAELCQQYMPCCAKAGKPSDGGACRAFYGGYAASATYNGAAANACLSEIKASSGSATFCETGMSGSSAPSCGQVFGSASGGTKKPGETCTDDDDCASSAEGEVECESLYKDGATIKKCQIRVVGKAGDTPCVGTVDGNSTSFSGTPLPDIPQKGYTCDVKNGLRCDGTTRTCVAIAKVGEACTGSGTNVCVKEAYCDSTTKVCAARKAAGSACEQYRDQCAVGTYCETTSLTCKTSIADGAPCKSSTECLSRSCVNMACAKQGSGSLTTAFLCGG